MRKLIILLFICACTYVQAQIKLVHKPSFEEYFQCPHLPDLVSNARYWSAIVNTSYTLDTNFVYHGNYGTLRSSGFSAGNPTRLPLVLVCNEDAIDWRL